MLDKLIAFVFSVITFFMSMFGSSFSEIKPIDDSKNPLIVSNESVRVMSYNIKSGGSDKISPENRVGKLQKMIDENSADVIGIQEATPFWMEKLPEMFGSKYDMVGIGRSNDESNEANPVLYLKDKYKLISGDTFWLSDTPDVMSNTWGGACFRICTYVVLENKQTGYTFSVFNTHFDHVSEEARVKSAELILKKIEEIAGDLPVILMGDLNSTETSQVYSTIKDGGMLDTRKLALKADIGKTGRTYHDYNVVLRTVSGSPIDYIFVNEHCKSVESFKIDTRKIDGDFPSDHYPLICDMTFAEKKEASEDVLKQSITVMTYNVYIAGAGDKSPENRTKHVLENIHSAKPDSFGLEEANEAWIERIAEGSDEYAYVGHGRDKDLGGEASPIFYLKDKYEVVKSGTFWLSKTPDKPSRGWDAMMNRICTYAVLKDKQTGFTYAHFNAHFDHMGVIARMNSVAVVSEKMAEIAPNMPIVFSGDLNDSESSEMYYRILVTGLRDTKHLAKVSCDSATYHGYSPKTETDRPEPIDFIFTNSYALSVESYTVDKTEHNGIYASDHHPVISKITFVN